LSEQTPDLAEKRFAQLIDRHVGFEVFDPNRAVRLPKKTYVAVHGRYVLLAFNEPQEAEQFFDAAIAAATKASL
jgi:hypothetical protein